MNDLLLNVDALEPAQEPFEADLPRELLDEVLRAAPATEFHAAGASHLRGKATKLGRKVLVQAKFTVPLEGQCKRCLRTLKLDETVDLTRTYVPGESAHATPREHQGDHWDASFDPGLTDEETYEGKQIDLRPALREGVLLNVPPSPLCSDDCKGLCPTCGKDLNEGDCRCDRTAVDPRWAALKGIQLEKKEK